jgi:hypothetical protein
LYLTEYLSLTSALGGVCGQRHAPTALTPGKTRYLLYRTLGGPLGLWTGAESLPLSEFDPRPSSHYTCWAIPAHNSDRRENKMYFSCGKWRCPVYIIYKSLPIKCACFTQRSSSAQSVSVRRTATEQCHCVLHFRDVGSTEYCTCSDVVTLHCWSAVLCLAEKDNLLRAMASCGLVQRCRCSEGLCCFHLQGSTTVVYVLQDKWQPQVWAAVAQTVLSVLLAC